MPLTHLVARARAGGLVLTSLMAKLNCESLAERALIPAFIFFFQMLYPFAWVGRRNDAHGSRGRRLHAGGARALERAGGMAAIRNALIDDCALAAVMKAQGPDLARPDRAGREPQALSAPRRYTAHGVALGLCPAPLLAACCSPARLSAWS